MLRHAPGGGVLRVDAGMPRCVMVDREQAGVGAVPSVLKILGRVHGTVLGVQATVLRPGRISLGDTVSVTDSRPIASCLATTSRIFSFRFALVSPGGRSRLPT